MIDARGASAATLVLCAALLAACVVPAPTSPTRTPTAHPRTPFAAPTRRPPLPSPTNAPQPQATHTAPPAMPSPTATRRSLPAPTRSPAMEALELEMFEAIDRERARYDLKPCRLDKTLGEIARGHAQDMVSRGYLGHVTPEGKTYRERLEERGLEPYWAGENYYYGFFPADEVVEAALAWFMDDPPHRDNILHEHLTRIGIGIVEDRQGAYTLVLDFAGD